jgi:hypothetical protein
MATGSVGVDPNYEHGVNELQAVKIVFTTATINSTHSYLNMSYNDTTGHTTGGYVDVLEKSTTPRAADTLNKRWYVTSNVETNSTIIAHPQGASGMVQTHVAVAGIGTVNRTFPYSLAGPPVEFMGFGADIRLLVALGIMLLTAMLAGAVTGRPVLVVVAMEGWIFYSTGFFQAMIDRGTPAMSVTIALIIVSVIAIAANIPYRRK